MKKTLLLITTLFLSRIVSLGQSATWMPELIVFYNLNSFDTEHSHSEKAIRTPGSMGLQLGMGLRVKGSPEEKGFFQPSFGFRSSQQVLKVTPSSGEAVSDFHFTNTYLYLKTMGGFKFKKDQANYLELALGMSFLYSLNKSAETRDIHYASYTDPVSGKAYRYLQTYYKHQWGDNRDSDKRLIFPLSTVLFHVQIAYMKTDLFPGNRPLRVGLEISSGTGGLSKNIDNKAYALSFNSNGTKTGESRFTDYHLSIGLNLQVGL